MKNSDHFVPRESFKTADGECLLTLMAEGRPVFVVTNTPYIWRIRDWSVGLRNGKVEVTEHTEDGGKSFWLLHGGHGTITGIVARPDSPEAIAFITGEAPLAEDSPESPRVLWEVPIGRVEPPELPLSQVQLEVRQGSLSGRWMLSGLEAEYLDSGDRLVLRNGEIVVEKAPPSANLPLKDGQL
jgi:hypothetical protein